jgi:hypothetical protein
VSGARRQADRAGAPTELSPQAVSSKAAHPSRSMFGDVFGKPTINANGEALGLVHGMRAERSRDRFRCGECGQYQRPGSWMVWVETGLRKDDPLWAFEDSAIYRGGHWSGIGWCLNCAPKRAKATPTRSAKTVQLGLVRRMMARCRKAFAPSPSEVRGEQGQ